MAQTQIDVENLSEVDIEAVGELQDGESGIMVGKTGGIRVREELNNESNIAYMGDLYFGSPPQKIRAIFDTGSANPWVITKNAREDHSFDTSKSTTFKDPPTKKWT